MVLGWPATQLTVSTQAHQLTHVCVLLAAAQFLRHALELGVGLVPGATHRSSVWACVPGCSSGSALGPWAGRLPSGLLCICHVASAS